MRILLFGANGNMGRRYRAIFNHLEIDYFPIELGESWLSEAPKCDKILIATPTNTHSDLIMECMKFSKPILCEKPIDMSIEKVKLLVQKCREFECDLKMVSQYGGVKIDPKSRDVTSYNYYQTGKDSIFWDCIQPIWFSKGGVRLRNSSPIYECEINGTLVDREEMDCAYVRMIQSWISDSQFNWIPIVESHEKVLKMINGAKKLKDGFTWLL